MASFGDGKIEAYVGPVELGAADNLEQVIVDFIGGAKKTLDIAIQEIDSRTIAQAILDARWRGVRVQMFIEQDYIRSDLRGTPPAPPTPLPGETPAQALERVQWLRDDTDLAVNRQILAALLRSDIDIKGDYNPRIFHQKFILRDYDGSAVPTSALLTGSANFTTTDTHRNLNNVVIFRNAHVCRQYLTEVEQLKRGSFGRGMHGAAPATYDLGGVPVRVLFAPDHTPELEIVKQILKGSEAQPEECYFAIFTFAGSSGIDDALLAMARGGMKVHGVLDRGQAAQQWAAPKWLKHANIKLYVPKKAGTFANLRKLHHKLMVIDELIVVAGSYNYTEPANLYNDENIFIMGSTHEEVSGVEVEVSPTRKLGRFFKAEIERIIALGEPYDPAA